MEQPEFEVKDAERVVHLTRVIGNLRRLEIMLALNERGAASASVLSKAGLGGNADVDYHHRRLAKLGAAFVAETKQGKRGAPQRFYKLTDFGREALWMAAILARKQEREEAGG